MCSINWAGWVQAVAAFIIVYFTGRSLMVLKDYARDTKKIASASAEQVENAQKPFVALVHKPEGLSLENQGFGPALDIRHTDPKGKSLGLVTSYIHSLAKSESHVLTGFYPEMLKWEQGITIEYDSLGSKKYRTNVIGQRVA